MQKKELTLYSFVIILIPPDGNGYIILALIMHSYSQFFFCRPECVSVVPPYLPYIPCLYIL